MKYKDYNDYELLYLFRNGDECGERILLDKYKNIVSKVSLKYYEKYRTKRIELCDLNQEGLLALVRAINCFDEEKDNCFYTFACICIERGIVGYCRKYTALKNSFLNESSSLFYCNDYGEQKYEIQDVSYEPTYVVDYIELYNSVLELKYSFNDARSQVLELLLNGFKAKEISILLDIPQGTANNMVVRIKKNIKKQLLRN